jgi:hypothetical protein
VEQSPRFAELTPVRLHFCTQVDSDRIVRRIRKVAVKKLIGFSQIARLDLLADTSDYRIGVGHFNRLPFSLLSLIIVAGRPQCAGQQNIGFGNARFHPDDLPSLRRCRRRMLGQEIARVFQRIRYR